MRDIDTEYRPTKENPNCRNEMPQKTPWHLMVHTRTMSHTMKSAEGSLNKCVTIKIYRTQLKRGNSGGTGTLHTQKDLQRQSCKEQSSGKEDGAHELG